MTTETQTTEQVLAKILTLCKNNGTTLDELLKLPVLDAEGKIPAALLRIVGALSAGHIIESGDNANGNYVRFADGTQICWINEFFVTTPGTVTYLLGTWTFPAEYVSFPAVVSTLKSMVGTQPYFAYATEAVDGATSVLLRYLHHNNEPKTGSQYARCIAIGRWKE